MKESLIAYHLPLTVFVIVFEDFDLLNRKAPAQAKSQTGALLEPCLFLDRLAAHADGETNRIAMVIIDLNVVHFIMAFMKIVEHEQLMKICDM